MRSSTIKKKMDPGSIYKETNERIDSLSEILALICVGDEEIERYIARLRFEIKKKMMGFQNDTKISS